MCTYNEDKMTSYLNSEIIYLNYNLVNEKGHIHIRDKVFGY